MPAKQRRLAGAVRPDHRQQRAGGDLAIEVMHRRMPVVAQRDVAKLDLRFGLDLRLDLGLCRHAHLIATSTTTQSPALTTSAAPKRAATVMRRIDQVACWAGCGVDGPWLWAWL
jgi:hypothetical protein